MRLNQLLQPQHNNLDVFRVMAALLVIYGHVPGFVVNHIPTDAVYDWLKFDYSGSLAVKFFFMLSGLLVTHSLLSRSQVIPFLVRRVARIFPGLLVCVFVSVFVVGLLLTSLPAEEYLLHPQTWRYWLHNSSLIALQWELPGVFSSAKTTTVNGSLWTLPLEVICYLCLAVYAVSIIRFSQQLASLLLLFPIGLVFFSEYLLPENLLRFKESLMLGGCFCIGVLFGLQRDNIRLQWWWAVLLTLILVVLWATQLKVLAFYTAFFYLCLWLSGTGIFIRHLRLPGDPSYGIYIYGFLIQQSLATFFPHNGIVFHQVVAALIAIAVGYLSWFCVEKPAMNYVKHKLEARPSP